MFQIDSLKAKIVELESQNIGQDANGVLDQGNP